MNDWGFSSYIVPFCIGEAVVELFFSSLAFDPPQSDKGASLFSSEASTRRSISVKDPRDAVGTITGSKLQIELQLISLLGWKSI